MEPTKLETIVEHITLITMDLKENGYSNTRFEGLANYFQGHGYTVDATIVTSGVTYYTIGVPYDASNY